MQVMTTAEFEMNHGRFAAGILRAHAEALARGETSKCHWCRRPFEGGSPAGFTVGHRPSEFAILCSECLQVARRES